MKISVKLALDGLVKNKRIDYELKDPCSLDELIDLMDQEFPGLRNRICTNQKEVVDHVNVYVNGDNVRYLRGLSSELKDGDSIHVIPAAAAG